MAYIFLYTVMLLCMWLPAAAQEQQSESDYKNLMYGVENTNNPEKNVTEADFNSVNAKRTVKHWKTGADYAAQTDYYYAAFADVFEGESVEKFLATGGEELGFAGRYDWGMVYLISVNGKYKDIFNILCQNQLFINLAPVLQEDVVAENIWKNERLSTLDSVRQTIKVEVMFWKNLSEQEKSVRINDICKYDSLFQSAERTIIVSDRSQLLKLASLDDVRYIHEYQPPMPVNDISRGTTRVNLLQSGHIDTITPPPPTVAWNRDSIYTGDSIWIGIAGGMDSTKNDLREQGIGARKAVIPGFTNMWLGAGENDHDTHCAGIAAGNGWMSSLDSTRGTRYRYRGVAPKARLANITPGGLLDKVGDVNSISYANLGFDGVYTNGDYQVDTVMSRHDTTRNSNRNNVWVYAAANNGGSGGYGNNPPLEIQNGYYSMLCNAKNPIKIGSVDKQTGLKSEFSSMGPTRDGRIGPDVMAPGSGSGMEKFHVLIDYIRLIGPTGAVKRQWNFNNSTDGMVSDPTVYHNDSLILICVQVGSIIYFMYAKQSKSYRSICQVSSETS
jgi:hypothetical protein